MDSWAFASNKSTSLCVWHSLPGRNNMYPHIVDRTHTQRLQTYLFCVWQLFSEGLGLPAYQLLPWLHALPDSVDDVYPVSTSRACYVSGL
jgi:hypothetical protein